MKRFVLIDGNALLHRAYHATPPLTTSKGELVNAVFGLTNMMMKTWDHLKPDYMAVAWDRKAPTFRHQAYTQYKATRGPVDDSLGNQYTRVHELMKAFGIPEFSLDGYEADDLIGTIALQVEKLDPEIEIIVLTGDRDIMQIIDDNTKVLMPKRTLADVGLYGEKEFEEKYGFKPIQIIDYKGLAGDASDNIPGVAGIGDITATKLIKQFGSVENIYKDLFGASLEDILTSASKTLPFADAKGKPEKKALVPPRTLQLLAEGAEQAIMSKKLATLDLNAPVKINLKDCEVLDYRKDEIIELFKELEFKSLVNKLTGFAKDPLKGENKIIPDVENPVPVQNKETSDLDSLVDIVLKKMTKTGVLIDAEFLQKMGETLKTRLKAIEEEIFKTVGHEFNLSSPKQLAEVLFDDLKLPVIKRTKTGRSTDEETLNELAAAHPMIPLFLEYRKLFKLVSTYIDALPKSIAEDGRVHSTFNVEGAATGRLSSTNPNLQNIPVRGQMGGEIRKAFIASPGKVLLGADYSQVELRILAHVSEDPNLIKAFSNGDDIHLATAATIYGIPLDQVSKEQRVVGKTMNFATLYGQGARALSKQLKIDTNMARKLIDDYFIQFGSIKNWMAGILEKGRKNGYVETIWGRRRYIPELNMQNEQSSSTSKMLQAYGERAAINHPIQGTSADMIKKAMIEVDKAIELRVKNQELSEGSVSMILQVHDELLFECDPKYLETVSKMIKEKMEGVIDLKVPVVVDLKSGKNWGEMSPLSI